jgi:hypothetical protein
MDFHAHCADSAGDRPFCTCVTNSWLRDNQSRCVHPAATMAGCKSHQKSACSPLLPPIPESNGVPAKRRSFSVIKSVLPLSTSLLGDLNLASSNAALGFEQPGTQSCLPQQIWLLSNSSRLLAILFFHSALARKWTRAQDFGARAGIEVSTDLQFWRAPPGWQICADAGAHPRSVRFEAIRSRGCLSKVLINIATQNNSWKISDSRFHLIGLQKRRSKHDRFIVMQFTLRYGSTNE